MKLILKKIKNHSAETLMHKGFSDDKKWQRKIHHRLFRFYFITSFYREKTVVLIHKAKKM